MKTLDIKTGFQCNNQCQFCIQGDKRNFKKTKSTEEIKQILKQNCDNFGKLVFTGGEVTIREDILEIVKYAKDLGYKIIQIQTNGRMFSYFDFCKKLIDAGVTEFGLSIHGSTPEIHDGLTRAVGSFEQTLQGILNLKKLQQPVLINSVVTRINYKDAPNIARILSDIGVKSYQFAFMHINSIILNNDETIEKIVPRYKEIKPFVEEGLQIGIDANVKSRVETIPFCILQEKYYNNISPDYLRESFIYEDDKLKDFRKMKKDGAKLKGERCRECKFFEQCEGPWSDYVKTFGFDEFKPIK
ncbi:MAG: radical SAM protein [Bacilli bacterium]|nr:radical SAM protein [Candidatus Paceibacterota bacterium]MDD4411716.1 radical SAM protein [Bacilli bacterium]